LPFILIVFIFAQQADLFIVRPLRN